MTDDFNNVRQVLCDIESIKNTLTLLSFISNLQDWKDTLKGRKVYVQLVITYRHGREEDETMGISFKKELIVDRAQVSIEFYEPEPPFMNVTDCCWYLISCVTEL